MRGAGWSSYRAAMSDSNMPKPPVVPRERKPTETPPSGKPTQPPKEPLPPREPGPKDTPPAGDGPAEDDGPAAPPLPIFTERFKDDDEPADGDDGPAVPRPQPDGPFGGPEVLATTQQASSGAVPGEPVRRATADPFDDAVPVAAAAAAVRAERGPVLADDIVGRRGGEHTHTAAEQAAVEPVAESAGMAEPEVGAEHVEVAPAETFIEVPVDFAVDEQVGLDDADGSFADDHDDDGSFDA